MGRVGELTTMRFEPTSRSNADYWLDAPNHPAPQRDLLSSQVIVHPMYNLATMQNNDIALLQLKTPLQLPIGGNLVAPICLPSRRVYNNADVEVAGWGRLQVGGDVRCLRNPLAHACS